MSVLEIGFEKRRRNPADKAASFRSEDHTKEGIRR